MGKQDLIKFVQEKPIETQKIEIDWGKKKSEWIKDVKEFYDKVKTWLREFENEGTVTYEFEPITITEENIGTYTINRMILSIAKEKVIFEPIGTLLIGAKGRIDMEGKYGKVKFVLVDKEAKGISIILASKKEPKKIPIPTQLAWKISTPPPKIELLELNADTFSDSLLAVING